MPAQFHWIDWAVLGGYILFTSWLGSVLTGKQQTIRDFFLGGRKLPWPAVCGSIVASEISGVTFVSVPAIIFAEGGNYTYLMLAVGTILARIIIGFWFCPAFYRREIYSPYEFMGQQLGPIVDRVTTGLFLLGALLAQGARLFLAALVLNAITHMGVPAAVLLLGSVSVVWTWMGGINTVVWTDVIQFVILFVGAFLALGAAVSVVPGGWDEVLRIGAEHGKLKLGDFRIERGLEFTFWCGLFGTTFLTLGSHGTDQMMAQRLFCCRDAGAARKAIIWSSVGVLLAAIMLTVGLAIFAYFKHYPMTPQELALYRERGDYLLPIFILKAMPVGVKGLLFAAIFSAATATSTLAAMGQTALSSFYQPLLRRHASEKELVLVSRIFIVMAAVGLSGVAIACQHIQQYKDLLRLALSMAAYTYGAVLGIFLLALLPLRRDAFGLIWAVPLTLLLIFALNWQHADWARPAIVMAVTIIAASAVPILRGERHKILWVLAGAGLVLAATLLLIPYKGLDHPLKLAFPWHFPIGTVVTLGLGYVLGRARSNTP